MKVEVLCMQGASKREYSQLLLDSFSFSAYQQEIVVITGLLDSGKSIVAKILGGLSDMDEGKIYVNEKLVCIGTMEQAYKEGIHYIGRETGIGDRISVAEHMCIDKPQGLSDFWINKRTMNHLAKDIIDEYEIDMNVHKIGAFLTNCEKRIVEILTATLHQAKVLVLHEVLSECTRNEFLKIIKLIYALKQKGLCIIIIESNIKSIMSIADRIIVMRSGTLGGVFYREYEGYDENQIYKVSKQTTMTDKTIQKCKENHPILITVKNIQIPGFIIKGEFYVKEGETVGFVEEDNHAADIITNLLCGEYKKCGEIKMQGRKILIRNRKQAVKAGIVSLEGYNETGAGVLFEGLTIGDNMMFMNYNSVSWKIGIMKKHALSFAMREYAKIFGINEAELDLKPREADYYTKASVPLIRLLIGNPKIILMNNSFVRSDSIVQEKILDFINHAKERNISIVLSSSSREEVEKLCDRAYILVNNEILPLE